MAKTKKQEFVRAKTVNGVRIVDYIDCSGRQHKFSFLSGTWGDPEDSDNQIIKALRFLLQEKDLAGKDRLSPATIAAVMGFSRNTILAQIGRLELARSRSGVIKPITGKKEKGSSSPDSGAAQTAVSCNFQMRMPSGKASCDCARPVLTADMLGADKIEPTSFCCLHAYQTGSGGLKKSIFYAVDPDGQQVLQKLTMCLAHTPAYLTFRKIMHKAAAHPSFKRFYRTSPDPLLPLPRPPAASGTGAAECAGPA